MVSTVPPPGSYTRTVFPGPNGGRTAVRRTGGPGTSRPGGHWGRCRGYGRILEEAGAHLLADEMRAVLVGEFKAGESSLLDGLLDDADEPPLLPEAEEI